MSFDDSQADDAVKSPGLLICEGIDDVAFFNAQLASLRSANVRADLIQVESYNGLPKLRAHLDGLSLRPGREILRALAIVRDADQAARPAFDSVRGHLRATDFAVRVRPGQFVTGTWDGGTALSVGVFIMPDNQSSGAIEDLCLQAVAADGGHSCVTDFLNCVTSHGGISWRPQDVSKARLNAWLASRSNPTLRLGQAISARQIPADAPAFGSIRAFLVQLAAAANADQPLA